MELWGAVVAVSFLFCHFIFELKFFLQKNFELKNVHVFLLILPIFTASDSQDITTDIPDHQPGNSQPVPTIGTQQPIGTQNTGYTHSNDG